MMAKFFMNKHNVMIALCFSFVFQGCNLFVSDDERLLEAETFYEQGELNAASLLAKKILKSNPESGEARLLFGKIEYARFKLPAALDSFAKAKAAGLKNEALFSFWVKTLLAKNDLKEVSVLYADPYFKVEANSPAGILLKGDLYFFEKDKDRAKAQYALHFSNTKNKAINCISQVKLLSIDKQLEQTISQSLECEKIYMGDADFDKNINQYIRVLAQLGIKKNEDAYATLNDLVKANADSKDVSIKVQSYLLLLKMHLVKGDIEAASKLSDRLQQYLFHPDMYYTKAMLAAKNKDFSLAEQNHLAALKLNKNYRPSLLELINIKYSQGNVEQAKLYASRVDNISGNQVYSQRLNELLTITLFKKGDLDSVIDNVVAMDSGGSLKSKYLLSLSYAKKGEVSNTWKIYDQIAKDLKTVEQKDMLKAKLNLELGKLSDAEAIYNKYLKTDNLNAMLGLSEVYLRTNKPEQVEVLLQRALATGKDDKKVVLLLVRFYSSLKQHEKSYVLLNKMISKTKDNVYRGMLAKLYYQQHRYTDAAQTGEEILTSDSENHTARLVAGSAYMRLKNYSKAENMFKVMISQKPDFMKGYLLLAKIAHINSYKEQSLSYLDQALKVKSDFIPAIHATVDIYVDSKQNDLALNFAKNVTASLADKKMAYLVMGVTYTKLGESKKAYEQFNRAIEGDSTNIKLAFKRYQLAKEAHGNDFAIKELIAWLDKTEEIKNYLAAANFVLSRKEYVAAKQFYENYLEKESSNPVAYNNLSWIYSELGETKKALVYARKALTLAPNSPAIMDTVGWLLVQSKEYDEAEGYLTKAYNRLKNNPSIGFHLASLYYHQNKRANARAILKIVVESDFAEKEQAMALYEKL